VQLAAPWNIRTLAVLAALSVLGCAQGGGIPSVSSARWDYFQGPSSTDPWSPKIAGWQSRETAALDLGAMGGPAQVSGPAEEAAPPAAIPEVPGESDVDSEMGLRDKYLEFRRARKRAMAQDVAAWIQSEARIHYVPDGAIDHWATLEETLERDGDDCDGLELLVYHFLRDLGFAESEVYRAIVVRPEDGQHHMVTFWFEDPGDPWVIDPTGAMTAGMPRMSEIPGWVPLKIFSETEEFSARPLAAR
jgi:hypothetical protein